jgi:hypothetical protein
MATKKPHRDTRMSPQTTTPGKVSFLHHYASPKRGKRKEAPVLPILVDDPYALGEPAMLRQEPKKAETDNPDFSEWITPAKKPIEILVSRRDVIAGMYSRGQIDKAMFLAARDYERIYTVTMALPVKTIDPSTPVVSGGEGNDAVDAVRAASDKLSGF